MNTLKTTGVVLPFGLWMSGLSFADETSVREHLATSDTTTYLQQGDFRIELTEPTKGSPSDALVFQKYIRDLPPLVWQTHTCPKRSTQQPSRYGSGSVMRPSWRGRSRLRWPTWACLPAPRTSRW